VEQVFDRDRAFKQLARYRRKGPEKTTRLLIDALLAEGVDGHSLLDIGGGVGAIQHELLEHHIAGATNFEASQGNIEACRDEADRRGHGQSITHLHGDFAEIAEEVPAADIVTLERVICCYPDLEGLLSPSCAKSGKLLGLVYPHEAWWVKLVMTYFLDLALRLTRNPFRVFLHPVAEVERLVESHGFERRFYQKTGPWQVAVYARTG
jgi:magnesium-protoporphyrin O-methyltransferase